MSDPDSHTVLSTLTDRAAVDALAESCARVLPGAVVRQVTRNELSRLSGAAALVVNDQADARVARAAGFPGGIVVIGNPIDDAARADAHAQGTHFADPKLPALSLHAALTAACDPDRSGSPRVVDPHIARTRRLLAAGELALGVQHAFNNPLAALMTEVQLLQLDAPTPAVRSAADRMLELVRRLTAISRTLDAVRKPPSVE